MRTPLQILQDTVIIPVHDFQKKFLSKTAAHSVCKKAANFIFECSKETALVMLGFNAISILSSHLAQIGGLKKSNRENKDYLITQERHELGLDLLLTTVPPLILNRALKKTLESGSVTTKEARDKLINVVAPVVGASRDELYNIEYIRPVKENVRSTLSERITKFLQSGRNLPLGLSARLRNYNDRLKLKIPNPVTTSYPPNLEKITSDFDNLAQSGRISDGILSKFKNKSAYDDLYGLNNGLMIMTTIAYTILASNIIMPIIKNKLSNRTYEKQLKKMGETRESMKRKNRFSYLNAPVINSNEMSTFDTFMNNSNTHNNIPKNPISEKEIPKSPFNTFDKYNNIISQSTGLRI